MVKRIPSVFVDDEIFDKLKELKREKGWTWEELILSTIKKGK